MQVKYLITTFEQLSLEIVFSKGNKVSKTSVGLEDSSQNGSAPLKEIVCLYRSTIYIIYSQTTNADHFKFLHLS